MYYSTCLDERPLTGVVRGEGGNVEAWVPVVPTVHFEYFCALAYS